MANDVVVTGLARKRDEIDCALRHAEQRIVALRSDRATLEAAIKLFDPARNAGPSQPRPKGPQRSQYFDQGELARRCRDLLREANGGFLTTASVIDATLTAKGFDPTDTAMRRDFGQRILGAFYRMAHNSELLRTGEGLEASWQLA